jgi:hypothetical protein
VNKLALLMIGMVLIAPALGQTSQKVTIDGCLDKSKNGFVLNDSGFENSYRLIGKTSGLLNQIGDELKVTGTLDHSPQATGEKGPAVATLQVESIETVVHQIHNQTPKLGPLSDWKSFVDKKYGIQLKYPKSFETAPGPDDGSQTNFIPKVAPATLISLWIPRETYPNTTFNGGSLDISADPSFTHEGTCRQFALFDLGYPNTKMIGVRLYGHATTSDASSGADRNTENFHIFQNGVCYEFVFSFDMRSHNGLDLDCSMHWFNAGFENALIEAVLSQASFPIPLVVKAPETGERKRSSPSVDSFQLNLKTNETSSFVTAAWATTGTDYVQLTYECVKGLLADSEGTMGKCGKMTDRNLPPSGSVTFLVGNFNPAAVNFTLHLEPFVNGVGFPVASKASMVPIEPHPPLRAPSAH